MELITEDGKKIPIGVTMIGGRIVEISLLSIPQLEVGIDRATEGEDVTVMSVIPPLAAGGVIHGESVTLPEVGELVISLNKSIIFPQGIRKFMWALGLTNNRRKRHGLPMYRKIRRYGYDKTRST